MKLTPGEIIRQISEFWKKQSRRSKTVVITLAALVVVLAAAASFFLNRSGYTVLYSDLSSAEAGEIIIRLNDMGIESRLIQGGTLLVPKEQESQLRLTLSGEGFPQSTLSYDIFKDNSGFMTTDYEKKKYLLFQLQDRLQNSITTMAGIESAIVTISLPEESSFVLKADRVPPTASVTLGLKNGFEPDTRQIKSIGLLVSKSVPGLDLENVAIVDNRGNTLSARYIEADGGISGNRLEMEGAISKTLEDRILKLFEAMFGPGSVRVAVNTTIDVSQRISEHTTYTPVIDESGVISRQELLRQQDGGANGAEGGVAGVSANTGVPVYPQSAGADRPGAFSETSSTDYLVNQLREQVQRDGYEITGLSAAVLINSPSLTREEIDAYTTMVSLASGIGSDRVVVSGALFSAAGNAGGYVPPAEESRPDTIDIILISSIGAGSLALIILLVILLRRRGKKKRREEDDKFNAIDDLVAARIKSQTAPPEIVLNETREQGLKRQIKDFSSANPAIVAQLIRTWIKEDEEE